jgi:hypothetical protein
MAPPKIWMYPQMKKPVGILAIEQKFSFPVPESDSGISFSKFSVK